MFKTYKMIAGNKDFQSDNLEELKKIGRNYTYAAIYQYGGYYGYFIRFYYDGKKWNKQ